MAQTTLHKNSQLKGSIGDLEYLVVNFSDECASHYLLSSGAECANDGCCKIEQNTMTRYSLARLKSLSAQSIICEK